MAFIDAIHTREFVSKQLDLVLKLAAPGALVVFDDINFSENMRNFWDEVVNEDRFSAAFEFNGVGLAELKLRSS